MLAADGQRGLGCLKQQPSQPERGLVRLAIISAVGAAGLALAACALAASATPDAGAAAAGHVTTITLDGSRAGTQFQGIGAISGGSGNSRLLIDYPPAQRRQILDYLFKPHFGASLQILKLEIGDDGNAGDGAEPSVEHVQGEINCAAGYQFWLARQARAINPAIKLYGLQWGAPGWVGGSGARQTIWTPADVGYVIDWLNCAKSHGLRIDYIGGWNEHGDGAGSGGPAWYVALRAALDAAGYSAVQIVAGDSFAALRGPDVSRDLAAHPAFRSAVSVIGYHDSCQYPTTGLTCVIPKTARSLGLPVWQSEIGAMNSNAGAPAMARAINNSYIQTGTCALIEWPLIDSMPPDLPLESRGLLWADQPWSGYYRVNEMTWAIAHTTQFVQPGWLHIDGGNAMLGSADWGSYNSYESPGHAAWSMVVQTTSAPAAQSVVVHLRGGLRGRVVHVWRSDLLSHKPADWFRQAPSAHPAGGTFSYLLRPGYLYSFSTTAGQAKGHTSPPRPSPMPLPYTARPDASGQPWALAAQDGAFEYGPDGTTIEQTASQNPVMWHLALGRYPYAVLGGSNWRDYTVSAQVAFTAPGQSGGLLARFSRPQLSLPPQQYAGYQFTLAESGTWQLVKDAASGPPVRLASGTVPPASIYTWHTLMLTVRGQTLTAGLDGKQLASIRATAYLSGLAGITAGGWYQVDYRDLTVSQAS